MVLSAAAPAVHKISYLANKCSTMLRTKLARRKRQYEQVGLDMHDLPRLFSGCLHCCLHCKISSM